jgi:hypothetical protein
VGREVKISRVDAQAALKIIRHPKILPAFCDGACEPDDYTLPDDDSHYYLLAYSDDTLGIFICAPINRVLYHTHVAFLPNERKQTLAAGKLALQWIFGHTFAQTLITMTPSDNRVALWYARRVGFKKVGTIHQALHRNEQFSDFIISEVNRWQQ